MTLMCLRLSSKGSFTPTTRDKKQHERQHSQYRPSPDPIYEITRNSNQAEDEAQEETAEHNRRAAAFGGRVHAEDAQNIQNPRISKDQSSRQLIEKGILKNDFLKNLDREQINAVVDSMMLRKVEGNTFIIKEGDVGSHMYVAAEGKFEVVKGGKPIKKIEIGEVFGELALLYNAQRQASIKVLTKGKVWELERKVFQQIMVRTGLKQREDKVRFLQSVPLLKDVHQTILSKISDLLRVEFFSTDKCIIKQGDVGNTFYIISVGSVQITKRESGSTRDEQLSTLSRGEFFGERALLSNERRAVTITALSPGVECLVLDREPFIEFLGPIEEFNNIQWDQPERSSMGVVANVEYAHVELKDLEPLATLGVGGFGRVELVRYRKDNKTFALKYLKKVHVVQQQQEQHVYNEKKVMLECKNCPFVIRLYRTYKDNKYVYFLMEPCLGGDLFTILKSRHLFDEPTSRFMTACVIEAFEFLHNRNIVYRDLKPENVMLDDRGYLKVIDFGFAKKIPPTSKTWTFAGTPEYVAPEIILGKGHDKAADYWTLGIFMHELLVGKPPFRGTDHMRTYNQILRGIESVNFPKYLSKQARSLITRLCRAVATERLGCQRDGIMDIKNHEWFRGFKWTALKNETMKAPIIPQINGPSDTRHFDKYPRSKEVPPDESSGWDEDF